MASRPTKYAHVVKDLPKHEGETPDRLQLLTGLREEILATPFDEDKDWNIDTQIHGQTLRIQHEVQALLELAKKATRGQQTSVAFGRAYADANVVLDAIGEWKSSAQLLADAVERMMTDAMEAEGVRSLSFEDGGGVSTYQEPYGKVVDKEAFRQWCIANGYEAQLQLWPSTMNSISKERTLAGEPPPDGVEVTAKTCVRLNKA